MVVFAAVVTQTSEPLIVTCAQAIDGVYIAIAATADVVINAVYFLAILNPLNCPIPSHGTGPCSQFLSDETRPRDSE